MMLVVNVRLFSYTVPLPGIQRTAVRVVDSCAVIIDTGKWGESEYYRTVSFYRPRTMSRSRVAFLSRTSRICDGVFVASNPEIHPQLC